MEKGGMHQKLKLLPRKKNETAELLKKNGIVLKEYKATPYEYPITEGGVNENEADIQTKKNPFTKKIEEKLGLLLNDNYISRIALKRTIDITGEILNNMYRHRIGKQESFKEIFESAQFKIDGNHFVIVTKNPVKKTTKESIEETLKSTKDVSEEMDSLVDINTQKVMDNIQGTEDDDIKNRVLKTINATDDQTRKAVKRMRLDGKLNVPEKVSCLLKRAIKISTLRRLETSGLVYKSFGENGGAGIGFIRMMNKGALPPHAEFTSIASNNKYYNMKLSIRIPIKNNI